MNKCGNHPIEEKRPITARLRMNKNVRLTSTGFVPIERSELMFLDSVSGQSMRACELTADGVPFGVAGAPAAFVTI